MENLPYAQQAGSLENMLSKIKIASVPDKFSPDFVSTKLSMKGGTARSLIPFIKKMGLVSDDGTPTSRYNEFRNDDKSGAAIADSMKEVYSTLFEMNEYVYELDNKGVKRMIVEATGADANAAHVKKTLSTFTTLNKLASFEANNTASIDKSELNYRNDGVPPIQISTDTHSKIKTAEGINLSYTINLNLPATKEIEVFNAIFKSLKQHLLQD